MKTILMTILIGLLALTLACGKSSVDGEMIGQVKKVSSETPLICPNYKVADVSLGIMQNGTGSLSKEDVWIVVPDHLVYKFREANEKNLIVKVRYDVERIAPCSEHYWATGISW